MNEREWAKYIAEELGKELPRFHVEAGKKLVYANEILKYGGRKETSQENMKYETDILVYEKNKEGKYKDDTWTPRVVIETKLGSITTHGAITYSQKSASHKNVHPYLRYGIFIGSRKHHPLPGRLFRHGVNFDFMLSWKSHKPEADEWNALKDIIRKEITASKKLEEMIFDSRKQKRKKYFALHKPLVTYLRKY